jgi:hypothetical protein
LFEIEIALVSSGKHTIAGFRRLDLVGWSAISATTAVESVPQRHPGCGTDVSITV